MNLRTDNCKDDHLIANNNKACNAYISTLLGVQGTAKTKNKQNKEKRRKTDTTKLVLENL